MASPSSSLDRNARRRLRTRALLLRAAMTVFGTKAFSDTAVSEITETADVGSGSFYNHFDSKQQIYDAVITELIEAWDVRLQNALRNRSSDIAEITAGKLRAYFARSVRDPDWGRFMIGNGFAMAADFRGPWARILADVESGVRGGRYHVDDQEMATSVLLGGIFAILHGIVGRTAPDDMPDRGARFLMAMLGVDDEDARRLAGLPVVDADWTDAGLVEEYHLRGLGLLN